MPKPAHTRVTFEGVIGDPGTPLEHWSFNLNFPADALGSEGNDVVDNAIAAELAGAYENAWSTSMPLDTVLTVVKVGAVMANGHLALRGDGSYVQGRWEGSVEGATTVQPMPLQTACCISLVTLRSGPTGKGRFYIPWPAQMPEAATKRWPAATALGYANVAKGFLNAVGEIMTFPPHVVSSKGYTTPVTAVRVGRVPDTLRSRREDLQEDYQQVPLA